MQASPVRAAGSLAARSVPNGIAVGVHHSGPIALPDGKRPSVFIFNPVRGNWTEAKPFAPTGPEPQRAYATLSEPVQRIIGGVIALPETLSSEPSRVAPSSLSKPLEQVNPLSGYLDIDRIEPDAKGTYAINLPLLLRPSRGPGPSFSVRHTPQGGAGALGRGWDLTVSSIEARGPAPVYHPAYETEDYLLDGMELVALDANGKDIPALHKGGPIIPRIAGQRTFRLRANASGLVVRRLGNGPDDYFWEVWDPNAHVTRLYGGRFTGNDSAPASADGDGVLRGAVTVGDGPSRTAIGQWGLTAEYDSQPARNGALYFYHAADEKPGAARCTAAWVGDCAPALRLRRVEYNRALAGTAPEAGVTHVRFDWKDREPNRFNSDARLGLFRAHEYLLKEIVVHYSDPENVWLASLEVGSPANRNVLFARHIFEVSDGVDGCTNFDQLLTKYTVEANPLFDRAALAVSGRDEPIDLARQSFKFTYEGEVNPGAKGCGSPWPTPLDVGQLGDQPVAAPGGQLSFPADLLNDLGFGLLSSRSLLGTSRSEETGASLYVGVGPAGDTSSKSQTCCLKAGVSFSKSEGNSTLVDVTGDGIDDVVYRDGRKLRYCAGHRGLPDANGLLAVTFPSGRCGEILGVSDFATSSSDTRSVGAEYYPWYSTFAGVSFNSSQNETYVYFTDRDGDGLVDIVNYGRVLYSQGEAVENGGNVVRFSPSSALLPPIPGKVADPDMAAVKARVSPDMSAAITGIEAKLEATRLALEALAFSQTTVAWEAPMAGTVKLSGSLLRGESVPEAADAGPLGPGFSVAEFDAMRGKVAPYQAYIAEKRDCVRWAAEERCHGASSDPLGPHYEAVSRQIGFIEAPPATARLWVYRREARRVDECGSKDLAAAPLDLATVLDPGLCRAPELSVGEIRVETGDVIYLGYSIHPHVAAWLQPTAKIAYTSVDGDEAFNLFKKGGTLPDDLRCRWKDHGGAQADPECFLGRQTRYEHDLRSGLLPNAPTAAVGLPPGRNRRFGGRLEFPADLARDYQVFFDVVGEPRADPPPEPVPSAPTGAIRPEVTPNAELPRLFRHDLSAACAASLGTCEVDIAPACASPGPNAGCAAFADPTRAMTLASRITVLHRAAGVELPVRNVSEQLAALRWRIPPHVRSELTERVAPRPADRPPHTPTNASQVTVIPLPIAMGEPDVEYVRVEQGRFFNPDTSLDDGDSRPDEIFFKEFVESEPENVELARLRQTLALCAFAEEIVRFISRRTSPDGPPYAGDYIDHWSGKVDRYASRCDDAKARFASYTFTSNGRPEAFGERTLQLSFFLRELPFTEQLTSAETLLERVLGGLALGETLLTDAPRLTRRGYRLPAKANPFDCATLASGRPLRQPVAAPDRSCAFRLSANFAMQELDDVVLRGASRESRDRTIENMREVLRRFATSTKPAFRIDLAATVNGRPVAFRELTGEATGNDPCNATAQNTCLGAFGSRAVDDKEIAEHFYSRRRAGEPPDRHGDVFQRLTLNKRTGRAVAFSDAVMHLARRAYCPQLPPDPYPSLAAMERKQDCPPSNKYKGAPEYIISYKIGENNEFEGRNRVLEFEAGPLDLLEVHVRLSPIDETIVPVAGQARTLEGKFSLFDGSAEPPVGILPHSYLIPRAPSQILTRTDDVSDSDVHNLSCPQRPDPPQVGAPVALPVTCRPWTRLGWTELLLGAQYRTYSDAQKAAPGDNRFSTLRRREVLRLHPEIEVEASKFALAPHASALPAGHFPRADDVREARLAFHSRDPNVAKTGGPWSLFGGRADGRTLRPPPEFLFPLASSLRYRDWPPASGSYDPGGAKRAMDACAPRNEPDHGGCQEHLGNRGADLLALSDIVWFPLVHRFVGPVGEAAFDSAARRGGARPPTGICAAEVPNAIASCWKGADDTVFVERAVSTAPTTDLAAYSVSALIGFERPPIARFRFEFDSYRRLSCTDPENPDARRPAGAEQVCPTGGEAPTTEVADIPNRPTPPEKSRTIEVFAPVQGSSSTSVSRNAGFFVVNTHDIDTRLRTTRQLRDVNGDGFPDVISGGAVELTSPVGLTRREWWAYFRATNDAGEFGSGLGAVGFEQGSHVGSMGRGVGLSPSTAAKFLGRGTRTGTSGSTDAATEPSFDWTVERGHDESFVELRDFNGDGLADKLSGGTIGPGLTVRFNAGSGLGPSRTGAVTVGDRSVHGSHFNTSHSSGFGVRLGFSIDSGSLFGGVGLSHRDSGSQAALLDFTGDGRPDIVVPVAGGLQVFPNLGNGFGPGRLHSLSNWTRPPDLQSGTALSETTLVDAGSGFTYGFNAMFVKVVFTPTVKLARGQTRELLNVRDLNSDGVPDIVTVTGEFLTKASGPLDLDSTSLETRVHYNPTAKAHLLAGISMPSGAGWTLRHALLGNSGPENGRPAWVLSAAARFDGFVPETHGTHPDGHDVLLTTYAYENGYYNRAERQFYGFATRLSRSYGCSGATNDAARCLGPLQSVAEPNGPALSAAGFRKLQVVRHEFANRDFLTQGLVLSRAVAGAESPPDETADAAPPLHAVSKESFSYSIDDLQTLAGQRPAQCSPLDREPLGVSWNASSFSLAGSRLGPGLDGSEEFGALPATFGAGGLCGINVKECAETLRRAACETGFVREQRAFWAQQSGSVRRRLMSVESFGGDMTVAEPALAVALDQPRLRSLAAFDHDRWGQVIRLNSIGEASSAWTPQWEASAYAGVGHALRQGLNAVRTTDGVGYPMLGLAQDVQVFSGAWGEPGRQATPIRVREQMFSDNIRKGDRWKAVNLTDVCLYPGGEGFRFAPGLCATFKRNMELALGDGFSTIQDALRSAYAKTRGLPAGESSFDAVMHHQLVAYDEFGNLLHAVSPLSRGKDWVERRFDYARDPFARTPTSLALTRCVNDVAGAGTDSKDIAELQPHERSRCTFGLETLPDPILRKPVTHRSHSRIDVHFGSVAESLDVNGNGILFDLDRWGRLHLVARSWGVAPGENRTMMARIRRAIAKDPANEWRPDDVPLDAAEKWRVLAAVDYEKLSDGLLRSNVRRFESSDSYAGLLGVGRTTRETAMFADGLGRLVQSTREAEVCLGVGDEFIAGGGNPKLPGAGLKERCSGVATGVVMPGTWVDALGRELRSYEAYPIPEASSPSGSGLRFKALVAPPGRIEPLVSTSYDGAGRPLLVESRLSLPRTPGAVRGAAQHSYRIVEENGERLARFEALSLSPRCTASATWSDARGLRRTVLEDQARFYAPGPRPPIGDPPIDRDYVRDLDRTREACQPISDILTGWGGAAREAAARPGGQPARVSYGYDPLQQLTSVDSPLDGDARSRIAVRFDLLGRTREMQEPNSGCTVYEYDGLNALVSETGFRHGDRAEAPCGAASKVRNRKTYDYAGGRMIRMSYHSLEEQGGGADERDEVRVFYDRSPSAIVFGTPYEAQRFVPNDQANARFVDAAGRTCDNCIGQASVVVDRTGARAYAFNELGLARREVRSVVGPLRDVVPSAGGSETYLPEVAFYELESAYTAFGDPVLERFSESAPMNPAKACVKESVNACLARFTIGRRYAPDGAVAELTFNGRPLVSAAQDALGRPAVRWTASGLATGYRYDETDLRLNRMATLAASAPGAASVTVQALGYQYDGGGNILDYANRPPGGDYRSGFSFAYDPANRLIRFRAEARRKVGDAEAAMSASGQQGYDAGHRFRTRRLAISDGVAPLFERRWEYHYGHDPRQGPVHAPSSVGFAVGDVPLRETAMAYDDLGRMTRIRAATEPPRPVAQISAGLGGGAPVVTPGPVPTLLSNRAMTWDAEGRLVRVRGVQNGPNAGNERLLREDYVYDSGGNRTLKVHRPRPRDPAGPEGEAATLYLTPFYARPFDRRGTVQLAQGSLPAVSLAAPADVSESPLATYLYADLPVGSMTAAVTVFGEPTDASAVVMARREYEPYGLELTTDDVAATGRSGAPPLTSFHGKELDAVTTFSSFGARYYSRDAGMWLKPDPAASRYLGGQPNGGVYAPRNLSSFAFAGLNPTTASDPTGTVFDAALDAAFIVYDVGVLVHDEVSTGGQNRTENLTALGADIAGLAVPFATGGGIAVRGSMKIAHVGSAATHSLEKMAKIKQIGRAGEEFAEASLRERGYNIVGKQMHVVLENNQRMYIDFVAEKGGRYFAVETKAGDSLLRRGGQNSYYFGQVPIRRFSGEKTHQQLIDKGLNQDEILKNLSRHLHLN